MKHAKDIYKDIKKLSKEDITEFLVPGFIELVLCYTEALIVPDMFKLGNALHINPDITGFAAVTLIPLTYLGLRGLKLGSYLLEKDTYAIDKLMQSSGEIVVPGVI